MPTTLIGANINGQANYITMAHVGMANPACIFLSMNKRHYTNAGIKEAGAFSVNIPSVDLVDVTDYCGLVSGKDVDKASLFETFYGRLGAPMIRECLINMECQLVQTIDFRQHEIFIGEIVETFCDEACLTDGVVDFSKVNPILFVMNDRSYWKLAERFARAWSVGKDLRT
ncbi:MAG: flavin reductase family protein [Chloroflexi bacterium]|nr:flavin reductase family protein [Chloroflexota bacterium]